MPGHGAVGAGGAAAAEIARMSAPTVARINAKKAPRQVRFVLRRVICKRHQDAPETSLGRFRVKYKVTPAGACRALQDGCLDESRTPRAGDEARTLRRDSRRAPASTLQWAELVSAQTIAGGGSLHRSGMTVPSQSRPVCLWASHDSTAATNRSASPMARSASSREAMASP